MLPWYHVTKMYQANSLHALIWINQWRTVISQFEESLVCKIYGEFIKEHNYNSSGMLSLGNIMPRHHSYFYGYCSTRNHLHCCKTRLVCDWIQTFYTWRPFCFLICFCKIPYVLVSDLSRHLWWNWTCIWIYACLFGFIVILLSWDSDVDVMFQIFTQHLLRICPFSSCPVYSFSPFQLILCSFETTQQR